MQLRVFTDHHRTGEIEPSAGAIADRPGDHQQPGGAPGRPAGPGNEDANDEEAGARLLWAGAVEKLNRQLENDFPDEPTRRPQQRVRRAHAAQPDVLIMPVIAPWLRPTDVLAAMEGGSRLGLAQRAATDQEAAQAASQQSASTATPSSPTTRWRRTRPIRTRRWPRAPSRAAAIRPVAPKASRTP